VLSSSSFFHALKVTDFVLAPIERNFFNIEFELMDEIALLCSEFYGVVFVCELGFSFTVVFGELID
jgi:hypothetical protein